MSPIFSPARNSKVARTEDSLSCKAESAIEVGIFLLAVLKEKNKYFNLYLPDQIIAQCYSYQYIQYISPPLICFEDDHSSFYRFQFR